MKKSINPCLWFDGKAKEAAEFYCSILDDSVITSENQIVVTFESAGQKFMCLNGGEEIQCGWLKDRFGVSWQIVPTILGALMSNPARAERVTKAFLQMKKFEIEKLINA